MALNIREWKFKGHAASIINHAFQVLLVTYLVLLLIEQIWTGVISTYLNLNYLLIIVIFSGILDVFSEIPVKKKEQATRKDYFLAIGLGILGFIIIKFKTPSLGWLSWLISIVAGVIIILLSILVLEDDEDNEEEDNVKMA